MYAQTHKCLILSYFQQELSVILPTACTFLLNTAHDWIMQQFGNSLMVIHWSIAKLEGVSKAAEGIKQQNSCNDDVNITHFLKCIYNTYSFCNG